MHDYFFVDRNLPPGFAGRGKICVIVVLVSALLILLHSVGSVSPVIPLRRDFIYQAFSGRQLMTLSERSKRMLVSISG